MSEPLRKGARARGSCALQPSGGGSADGRRPERPNRDAVQPTAEPRRGRRILRDIRNARDLSLSPAGRRLRTARRRKPRP